MKSILNLENLTISLPHKLCFEDFSTTVYYGEKIAVIGRNGSGKSSLLRMIANIANDASCSHVTQVIEGFSERSGGERFNESLSEALGQNPDVLLLDEPTNHLDIRNRKSLIRMLQNYHGTLIIATHDTEILRNCIDKIWHIDNEKIEIICAKFDDYMNELSAKRNAVLRQIELLNTKKKAMQQSMLKEQERSAKSAASGKKKLENKRWLNAVFDLKAMGAEKAHGSKMKDIDAKKSALSDQLEGMRTSEIIVPKFSLPCADSGKKMLISIREASVGYAGKTILNNINFSVMSGERLAITGNNGSGKSTIIKAIIGASTIEKSGDWNILNKKDIGYLDQFYQTLDQEKSALETIVEAAPNWTHADIRKHLNDFLFRKPEEVETKAKNLSGGEKARLSLALLSVQTPKLLLLDELTNNIDMETKNHIIEVLKAYPGTMIVVSHDIDFLNEIGIDKFYEI
ncbi:erythromycin ABC transporter ATP-binding protein [Alphaproteobacteria bacterium]|nr:erythromycin ABC transporter ATP-binding protein [Alphaproteobacteria bacterium]